MKIKYLLYGLAILLSVSIGSFAQSLDQGITVDLPQAVIVGEKSLPAGEYEIRKESTVNPVLRFFSNDKLQYETAALPIPEETKGAIEKSRVVMEKVGDELYLTKVWIEGASTGFELPLPERARALKRELAQTVTARSTADHAASSVSAPAPASASASAPPAASEVDANSRTDRTEPGAEIAQNNIESEPLQVAQARDVEARPAPAAAAQQPAQTPAQQAPQAAAPSPAPAPSVEPAQAAPDTLPATASNWAQFLLIGVALITVSAVLLRG